MLPDQWNWLLYSHFSQLMKDPDLNLDLIRLQVYEEKCYSNRKLFFSIYTKMSMTKVPFYTTYLKN